MSMPCVNNLQLFTIKLIFCSDIATLSCTQISHNINILVVAGKSFSVASANAPTTQ